MTRDEAINKALARMDEIFGEGDRGLDMARAAMIPLAQVANEADPGSEDRANKAEAVFLLAEWIEKRHGEEECDAALDAANWM